MIDMAKVKNGDQVWWYHLPNKRRYGKVVDIDGLIGVETIREDPKETIYIEAKYLEPDTF